MENKTLADMEKSILSPEDLALVMACAVAMGLGSSIVHSTHRVLLEYTGLYDPLHNDVHAMSLVKKFGLAISPPQERLSREWRVAHYPYDLVGLHAKNADLNRAIVECVAKMQGKT